jgi:hypothetical protein
MGLIRTGLVAVLDLRAVASSAATVAIRSRLIERSTVIFSLQVWPHIRHSPCLLLSPPSPPSPTLLSFQLDPFVSLSSFAKPLVSSTLPLSRLQLGCRSVDIFPARTFILIDHPTPDSQTLLARPHLLRLRTRSSRLAFLLPC